MSLIKLKSDLKRCADKERAKALQRYFKTGPGEYAEGDRFIGVTAPRMRSVAKKFKGISLKESSLLLRSEIHEERAIALLILILKYPVSDETEKKEIYKIYLGNTKYINNWDLVDISAEHIVGAFLKDKNKKPLYCLATSSSLWERRIAILSTFHYIKNNEFGDTLKIAKILLNDHEDLIHKAVGWMLREVGKRDLAREERFLKKYYKKIPRTMLRYAIERFAESKRQAYLKGKI
ncbi:MAG: DNA alkylation repair protein [Candidatus Omnitrophica bacterium CG07_land_8_20_14_0_80_42_15]|uniref:DNA alkylation repair protein n=1 Tax=Candidatus Aquitaenariimonas noxiae TaxID=1974741 RepID=A0A2J0L2S6_9BACT|nr:MAG: DNA alkylation repair protein [Candidatus Omnitrophica bacterium CG07_land_8_20_14_0_80_42_15]